MITTGEEEELNSSGRSSQRVIRRPKYMPTRGESLENVPFVIVCGLQMLLSIVVLVNTGTAKGDNDNMQEFVVVADYALVDLVMLLMLLIAHRKIGREEKAAKENEENIL